MNSYSAFDFERRDPFWKDQENVRDLQRMKSMYPKTARKIQELAEEACDHLEYEGSMMFDEYPDQLSILKLCDKIQGRLGMEEQWAREMTEVLLVQEMYRRRCRRRNYQRNMKQNGNRW